MSKAEQRAVALAARRSLSPEERGLLSAQICARLLPLCGEGPILSYLALLDEADLAPLHEKLRAKGIELAFPRCLGGGVMEARVPLGSLRRGALGIMEPDEHASRLLRPEELRIVLCPCLAFDARGTRLGHGGGYYDRYLPQCTRAKRIAVAFGVQRLERVERGEHDVPMHAVVTERGPECGSILFC